MSALRAAAAALLLAACAPARDPAPGDELAAVAAELTALAGGLGPRSAPAFRSILERAVADDAYRCLPSPRAVFSSRAPEGERLITGVMPHYGFFDGPMRYRVRRDRDGWEVSVTLALTLPPEGGRVELPDCGLARELAGEADLASVGAVCTGTPYADSGSLSACPGSGTFSLPATRRNLRALLARWSREAPVAWNRDAARHGLGVRYRFSFVEASEVSPGRADIALPLSLTCGRTPYFASLRSGWSTPILAHEVGHVLGLLDEYEALSGLSPLYPKKAFAGAEISRMALSMREDTRFLPIHHYLVLRRAFCAEPRPTRPLP